MMRVLFISSIECAETSGGPVQMFRHFIERQDFHLTPIIERSDSSLQYLKTSNEVLNRTLRRLSRTKLFPYFVDAHHLIGAYRAADQILPQLGRHEWDAVVTVAYGVYSFCAARAARLLNLPLITFFHDWWPDLVVGSKVGKMFLDLMFRKLYRDTSLALCVCASMRDELGPHSNAQVLYPIPSARPTPVSARSLVSGTSPEVVYLGNMEGDYGRAMLSLAETYMATKPHPFRLSLFGPASDWPAQKLSALVNAGVYKGACFGAAASEVLVSADVLLVAMPHDRLRKRRVKTSFPSKLLDYCRFGKPIVIWAPEYSSVAKMILDTSSAALVVSPDPRELLKEIRALTGCATRREELAQKARLLADGMFHPDNIQRQLVDSVERSVAAFQNRSCSRDF